MVDLSFSLEGAETVSHSLGITAAGVKTFKEPLKQVGTNFMKIFDVNFSARGALFGGWAPRKPQYLDGKRIDTWPLLEKTGRMRKSFYQNLSNTSLTLGNNASYFVYHQSRAPHKHVPRRVMMKIRSQEATMIVKEFQKYLVYVMRQAGGR